MGEINLRVPPKPIQLEVTVSDAILNELSSCMAAYSEVQRLMLSADEQREARRHQYRTNVTGWLIFFLLIAGIYYGIKAW